jgi:hypothetical protein
VRWSLDGVGTIVVNFASNPEGRGGDVIAECIGVAEAIPRWAADCAALRRLFVAGAFADVGDIPIKPRQHLLANPVRLFGMTNHPQQATRVSPEEIQDRLGRHVRFRRIPVARPGGSMRPTPIWLSPVEFSTKPFRWTESWLY